MHPTGKRRELTEQDLLLSTVFPLYNWISKPNTRQSLYEVHIISQGGENKRFFKKSVPGMTDIETSDTVTQ